MKKEVMKKWVKALRSGKYKKGTELLKYKDIFTEKTTYCCLGVAKEIGLCNAKPGNEWVTEKFCNMNAQEKLAEMNDSCRFSFDRIADYIEKNYKGF